MSIEYCLFDQCFSHTTEHCMVDMLKTTSWICPITAKDYYQLSYMTFIVCLCPHHPEIPCCMYYHLI